MMNAKTLSLLVVVVVLLAAGFVGVSIAMQRGSDVAACKQPGRQWTATIVQAKVTPAHIDAKQCDRLVIINRDKTVREVAFGLHEDHVPYDGITERTLGRNQSLTVTLNQTGSFRFHDHFHDEVQGTFTVR